MVARYVRDVEVPGSNPGSPTSISRRGYRTVPLFLSRSLDYAAFIEEKDKSTGLVLE